MKRLFCLLLVLLILAAPARADGIPLSDLTTDDLNALQDQIKFALEADHSVAADSESRMRTLINAAVQSAGRTLTDDWENCAVTREWSLSFLTVKSSLLDGIVTHPVVLRAEAVLADADSGDRLIFLSIDSDILVNNRAELTDPRLLSLLDLDDTETAAIPADRNLGISKALESPSAQSTDMTYILNVNTQKFHFPVCASVRDIKPENRLETTCSRDDLITRGYKPCGRCKP